MNRNNKEKIIEELLLQNYNAYYRLAYSYLHNDSDAKDVVQEGAYRAILKSHTLKKEVYAGTWIYRIMLNEIFRFRKRRGWEPLWEVEETTRYDNDDAMDLVKAIQKLGQKEQAVVQMRFFEEMKLDEIAMVLKESPNTVKSRLYRSLAKLRLTLEENEIG